MWSSSRRRRTFAAGGHRIRKLMAASAPARLERIAFRTSRLLDFVERRELTAQIGHAPESWPLVIVKELVDNALPSTPAFVASDARPSKAAMNSGRQSG